MIFLINFSQTRWVAAVLFCIVGTVAALFLAVQTNGYWLQELISGKVDHSLNSHYLLNSHFSMKRKELLKRDCCALSKTH